MCEWQASEKAHGTENMRMVRSGRQQPPPPSQTVHIRSPPASLVNQGGADLKLRRMTPAPWHANVAVRYTRQHRRQIMIRRFEGVCAAQAGRSSPSWKKVYGTRDAGVGGGGGGEGGRTGSASQIYSNQHKR